MRIVVLTVAFALLTASAFAQNQQIDSYVVKYYAPGAPQPMQQTDAFQASAVQCNQVAPSGGSTVNPNRLIWDDPAVSGRVCIHTIAPGATLLSLPVGNYEATLSANNGAGGSSESNRASFSRQTSPGAPSGFRFIR